MNNTKNRIAVEGLFADTGELHNLGSDKPFLLAGEHAWLVRSGRVDVYAVAVKDLDVVGSRNHFFRAEARRLLLPTHSVGDRGMGLLAVGAPGTVVMKIPLTRLHELAHRSDTAGMMAVLLEEWVEALCTSISRDVIPKDCIELEAGTEHVSEGMTRARSRRRISWVKHEAGASLLLGRDGLKVNGAGFTPLARRAWVEMQAGSRLRVEETKMLISGPEIWQGLSRLHDLVLHYTMQMVEHTLREERVRLRTRAAASQSAFDSACADLASTLEPVGRRRPHLRHRPTTPESGESDTLFAACRLVGEVLDLTMKWYPTNAGGATPRDQIGAIARASRIRTRRVVLRDGWWRQDGGPLVAYIEEDKRPVALLPAYGSGYVLHDPLQQTEQRVTAKVADSLSGVGHTFYRSFPDDALLITDVLKFGLRGSERDLVYVLAMGTAAGLLSLLTPIATGVVFNDIIPGADRPQLVQLTLILLVIAVATALFNLAGAVCLVRIEGKMGAATQSAVWDRLLGLPMPFFRPYAAGDLATRAMGIDAIRQVLSGATITALLGGMFSLFHFGLLFHYSTRLAWWATLLIGIAVAVAGLASYLQLSHQRGVATLQGRIAGTVLQLLNGISKLRVAGAEVQAFAIWARRFGEQRQLQFRARTIGNAMTSFNAGYSVIAYLAIYAVALPLMTSAGATLRTGDFMAFMSSFGTCLSGMLVATMALLSTLTVIPLYEQAQPILTTPPEVDTSKSDPGVLAGDIEVQHLAFRYHEDGPLILRDVSLHVKAGEFVAFVGPSGSGKSTALRLLLGFETSESGAVYYDGQELSGLDIQAVRRQIGVVLQNGRLMSGDIFTNIVGSSNATLEDAWEAARMAGFAEDVKAMPMGMHTVVSEGGSTLSGGQRQRLMIARAIVQRPRLLFFDEATSALDNRTQAIVSESLDRLQATRIVIAHRLSTIVHADQIYVMENGRIVQNGTYEQLLGQDGLFRKLAERQLA